MGLRGPDPLVRVGDDVKSFLDALEPQWHVTSPLDDTLMCVRYSVVELLLLPAMSVGADVRDRRVLTTLVAPHHLTSVWTSMVDSGFTAPEALSLEALLTRIMQWVTSKEAHDIRQIDDASLIKAAEDNEVVDWDEDDTQARWAEQVRWSHLAKGTTTMIGRGAMILTLFGPRSGLAVRDPESELMEVARMIDREFDAVNVGASAFSERYKVPRMVKWAVLDEIDELFFEPAKLLHNDSRLDAVILLFEAVRLAGSDPNRLVQLMLHRVLEKFEHIKSFVGVETGPSVVEALLLIASKLCAHKSSGKLTRTTLRAVDEELKAWNDTFVSRGALTMVDKLNMALSSARPILSSGSKDAEGSGLLSESSGKAEVIRKVLQSKLFLSALERIEPILESGDEVNELELFHASFQSKCGLLMKHMAGAKDFSVQHPTLLEAAQFRLEKFEQDKLRPLSRSIAEVVLPKITNEDNSQELTPLLRGYTFSNEFVSKLVSGKWHQIDFPKHLVLNIREITHNAKTGRRDRNSWYTSTSSEGLETASMLVTLSERMRKLFCEFLPYEAEKINGVESVIQVLTEAMDLSGSSPLFEADVKANANQYILQALEDAGRQWSSFWHSAHPGVEVPSIFLPKSSSCKVDLDNSMESAAEFRFGANANPIFYKRLSQALEPKGPKVSLTLRR